ncbi:MAG: hypothetical protein RIQ53_3883 [Pseudomonadota bacterium]|jgi:hypothetical protein
MTVDTDTRPDLLPLVAGALSQGCAFAALGVALWPSRALAAAALLGGCGLVCGALIQRLRGRHRALPPRPVAAAPERSEGWQASRATALREAVARGATSWLPLDVPGAMPASAGYAGVAGVSAWRAAAEAGGAGATSGSGSAGDATNGHDGPSGPSGSGEEDGGPAAEPPRATSVVARRRWVDGRPPVAARVGTAPASAPVAEPLPQP